MQVFLLLLFLSQKSLFLESLKQESLEKVFERAKISVAATGVVVVVTTRKLEEAGLVLLMAKLSSS